MTRSTRFGRRFAHASAAAGVLGMALVLAGFMRISFGPTQPPFSWGAAIPVSFVLQADGSADVPDQSDHTALRVSFDTWQALGASSIAFTEDTAADASRTDFDAQDLHLVMWDEDGSSGLFAPGSSIVALTPLLASTATGQILDADIVFNGALPFSTTLQGGAFDVQSVATHEIGHMIGLDHSGGPLTTMNSTIVAGSSTARSLSRDEEAGAAFIYPQAGVARGRITGNVFALGGGGLRFAQVVAVDDATGEVAGAGVSDAAGNYSVLGLPAGTYSLYAEPLDGPFRATQTIALQSQTADAFATTWYPSNPVTLGAGAVGTATWSVDPDVALTITDSNGGRVAAGAAVAVNLFGSGLSNVVSARVTGGGVTVTSLQPLGGQLRLTLAAGALAPRGVRSIEVTDAQGRVAVLTAGLDVQDPEPRVTLVTPTTLDALGGEQLTITGTNFASGSLVVVGGQPATNVVVVGSTQVRCNTPPSPGTTAAVDVVVLRPDGREARAVEAVTYRNVPRPTSVDPDRGQLAGGTPHRVLGAGFAQGAVVELGGVVAQVTGVTATTIDFVLPPGAAAGPVDVVVRVGGEEGFLASGLTYVNALAPQVTAITPTSGPANGGTQVTLAGQGFAPDAQVTFDGLQATGVTAAAGGGELTATSPAHAAGAAQVRVRNPATGLVGLAPDLFTYTAPEPYYGGGSSGGCAVTAPRQGAPAGGALGGLAAVALALALLRRRRALAA